MSKVANYLKNQKKPFSIEDTGCVIVPIFDEIRKVNLDLMENEYVLDVYKNDKLVAMFNVWNDNSITLFIYRKQEDIDINDFDELEKALKSL